MRAVVRAVIGLSMLAMPATADRADPNAPVDAPSNAGRAKVPAKPAVKWTMVTSDGIPVGAAKVAVSGTTLVLAACGDTDECTLQRSTDGGATWTADAVAIPIDTVHGLAVVGSVALVETDDHKVWALAGDAWKPVKAGGKDAAFLAGDGATFYVTAGGSLYSSKDGAAWTAVAKLPAGKTSALGVGTTVMLEQGGGNSSKLSRLDGAAWKDAGRGALACVAGNRVVAVANRLSLRASTDGAKTWTTLKTADSVTSLPNVCTVVPNGNGVLMLINDTAFALPDGGTSLLAVGDGISGSTLSLVTYQGHALLLASDGDAVHLYSR